MPLTINYFLILNPVINSVFFTFILFLFYSKVGQIWWYMPKKVYHISNTTRSWIWRGEPVIPSVITMNTRVFTASVTRALTLLLSKTAVLLSWNIQQNISVNKDRLPKIVSDNIPSNNYFCKHLIQNLGFFQRSPSNVF